MPRFLITGGNIGDPLAEMLAARGAQIRVMVRAVKPNERWRALGIEQAAADLTDVSSVERALEGVDGFFSVTPFVENLAVLGRNVVEAARRAGVRRIVRASALGAGPDGITMARWHWEVERAVEDSGIPFTILQPNTFMQSYFSHAPSIAASNTFYLPQGSASVSLVDVRDIAAVAAACLTEDGHEGKHYIVTGAKALSNDEIADELSSLLGRTITYTDVPPERMRRSLEGAGVPGWMTAALLELFALCKAGYAAGIFPTVASVAHRAPIPFERFLWDHAAAFGAEGVKG
jgi:uncharacterized protein YbjT (DUF2867 family)